MTTPDLNKPSVPGSLSHWTEEHGKGTLFSGIDIGTETVNLVIMNEEEILHAHTEVTEEGGFAVSQRLLEQAKRKLMLPSNCRMTLAATGIGKKTVTFAQKQSSDMVCHARGALWLFPEARTVLDIGASGNRAMSVTKAGKVEKFALNSKCASGTGSFLWGMTKVIEASFEEMTSLSSGIEHGTKISNYCAVFAESEVISKIHGGEPKSRIVAGIYDAVVDRLMEQLNRVGIREEVVVTGGVARNTGLIRALERRIGRKVRVPQDPQIVGALGAALFARVNVGQE